MLSQEANQNPKNAKLEQEARELKKKAEQQSVLGRLELGEEQTRRGTESRGIFYDETGMAQKKFDVESEGAFFSHAPHLHILTETHVFDTVRETRVTT